MKNGEGKKIGRKRKMKNAAQELKNKGLLYHPLPYPL